MLILKCSACRKKLWKYDKIGPGQVLRCHKDRIVHYFGYTNPGSKVSCMCGNTIGIDKGSYYKMIAKAFTYSGKKRTK